LSNDISDIIPHCLHRQIFRARKKRYLWGKQTYPLYYEIKETEVEKPPAG
jgi:hypothetical protein